MTDDLQKGYEFDAATGEPYPRPDYDYERLKQMAGPERNGWAVVTVNVSKGETAWNPASTKHVLYGPLTIRYEFYRDGGVRGEILAGEVLR
jgi:hypothetical protein